jgi:hypothetical protein
VSDLSVSVSVCSMDYMYAHPYNTYTHGRMWFFYRPASVTALISASAALCRNRQKVRAPLPLRIFLFHPVLASGVLAHVGLRLAVCKGKG